MSQNITTSWRSKCNPIASPRRLHRYSYEPEALDDADKDVLITFAITFLSPNYVNNPFLKARLVSVGWARTSQTSLFCADDGQILANGLYPVGYFRKGTLFERLGTHSLSTQCLMPTLIRFFIGMSARLQIFGMLDEIATDVEMTGGHTQFWGECTAIVITSLAHGYIDKFNFR